MKKLLLSIVLLMAVLSGCMKDDLDDIRDRLSTLEAWQTSVNSNITSLQSLVQALQNNDYVTGVTALSDGSGYTINFKKSGAVTIKNGEKGDKGAAGTTPVIGVEAVNGVYY